MLNSFRNWYMNRRTRRALKQKARQTKKLKFELLEDRWVLTSNLYLDFGDLFPTGGLTASVLQLRDTFANGGIQGPDLTFAYADTDTIRFDSMAPLINFTSYTQLRDDVLSLVQRYYQTLDVNVMLAPALDNTSSATYLAGISTTLQLGTAAAGERDQWVLVTQAHLTSDNSEVGGNILGPGSLLFGIATANDLTSLANLRDDTGLVFADTIIAFAAATSGNQAVDTSLAFTTAHEAAHNFGLRHTTGFTADDDLLSDGDVIRTGGSIASRSNLHMFTSYPLRHDNNAVFDNWVFLAGNNSLGFRAGAPEYVTGTGANDVITLTSGGAGVVNVSVQAYRDPAYTSIISIPGSAATAYTYSVSTANGILIDGGVGNDRIVITGNLGVNITLRGMGGTDQLLVNANNAVSATYTPGATSPFGLDDVNSYGGTISYGTTTINFSEYETSSLVQFQNAQTLTIRTPNSSDDVDIGNPIAGQNRATITSGGVLSVPFDFFGITTLIIDTSTNDVAGTGDDVVTIGTLQVAALQSLMVNTGLDDDTLTLNGFNSFALPVAGGSITYNAGGGAGDTIAVVNDVATMTLGNNLITSSGGGTLNLSSVERANLTGGALANTFVVNGWNGTAVNVNGGANTDNLQVFGASALTANYTPGSTGANGALTGTVTLPTMGVTFTGFETGSNMLVRDVTALTLQLPNAADVLSFSVPVAGQNRVSGTSGGINIAPLTFTTVLDLIIDSATADAAGGNDAITYGAALSATSLRSVRTDTGNGNDTVTVNTAFTGTAMQNFTVNGGGGDDTLAVNLANYSLPVGGGAFTFNGDGHGATGDTIAVTNDVTTTTLTSTSVASSSGGTINLTTVERANLTGAGAANTFTVNSWAGTAIDLNGAGGNDIFNIGGSVAANNLDTISGNITITGGANTDTLNLNDAGHALVATYIVDATTVTSTPTAGGSRTFGTLTFTNTLENLTLNATTAANILNVTPSLVTNITVNANNPPAAGPGDDFLVIDFIGTTGRVLTYNAGTGNGNWAFTSGHRSVVFTSVERTNDQIGFAAAAADPGRTATPLVKYIDVISGEVVDIMAYESTYRFGVQVAAVDLDNDGIPEVITAPNKGRAPEIKIFKIVGTTGVLQQTFLAYAANFRNGVNIAAADVDNDGLADIIVTPIRGVVEVRVFKNLGGGIFSTTPMLQFNAFTNRFAGGGSVTATDLNADGRADIIVGSGSGIAATIVAFNSAALLAAPPAPGTTPAAFKQFSGFFAANFRGGVSVTTGHVNGVNTPDIIVGQGVGGNSLVAILDGASGNANGPGFNPTLQLAQQFSAYGDTGNRAAIYVTARDTNNDGIIDFIFTGQASDGRTRGVVRRFAPPFGTGLFTQVPFFGTTIPGGFSVG